MAGSRGGCAGRVTRDAEKRKLSKALQEARGEPSKHWVEVSQEREQRVHLRCWSKVRNAERVRRKWR